MASTNKSSSSSGGTKGSSTSKRDPPQNKAKDQHNSDHDSKDHARSKVIRSKKGLDVPAFESSDFQPVLEMFDNIGNCIEKIDDAFPLPDGQEDNRKVKGADQMDVDSPIVKVKKEQSMPEKDAKTAASKRKDTTDDNDSDGARKKFKKKGPAEDASESTNKDSVGSKNDSSSRRNSRRSSPNISSGSGYRKTSKAADGDVKAADPPKVTVKERDENSTPRPEKKSDRDRDSKRDPPSSRHNSTADRLSRRDRDRDRDSDYRSKDIKRDRSKDSKRDRSRESKRDRSRESRRDRSRERSKDSKRDRSRDRRRSLSRDRSRDRDRGRSSRARSRTRSRSPRDRSKEASRRRRSGSRGSRDRSLDRRDRSSYEKSGRGEKDKTSDRKSRVRDSDQDRKSPTTTTTSVPKSPERKKGGSGSSPSRSSREDAPLPSLQSKPSSTNNSTSKQITVRKELTPQVPRSTSLQSLGDHLDSTLTTPIGTSTPNTPSTPAVKKVSLSEYSLKRASGSTAQLSATPQEKRRSSSQSTSTSQPIADSGNGSRSSSSSGGDVSTWRQAVEIHKHIAEDVLQGAGGMEEKLEGKARVKLESLVWRNYARVRLMKAAEMAKPIHENFQNQSVIDNKAELGRCMTRLLDAENCQEKADRRWAEAEKKCKSLADFFPKTVASISQFTFISYGTTPTLEFVYFAQSCIQELAQARGLNDFKIYRP
ncbi:hypothetical protein HDV05_005277 [Chytridiales sp. JEL 0842]|nr:hypothetical protein HDV05_005277 [Chytridiales sp. JEL 0842]